MSTRANVIIQESYKDYKSGKQFTNRLYFYRHSDGYPEGVMPTLDIFVKWLKSGNIRNNLSQSAGWLVLLGAMEYNTIPEYEEDKSFPSGSYGDIETIKEPKDWKVGAYEPTNSLHGDIEHLYVIDLTKKEVKEIPKDSWDNY